MMQQIWFISNIPNHDIISAKKFGQWKNSTKASPTKQLRFQNSLIDQMLRKWRGHGRRNGSNSGMQGRGIAGYNGPNTNRLLKTAKGSSAPQSQSLDAG
jgi:hypothetical protein